MQLPVLNEIKEKAQQAFQVPNFNPVDYLTCYTNSDGSKSYYLEVKYRIMWFRYCYPLGRIKVDILHHDEKSILVSATIYMDWTAEDHQFLCQAFAHKYKQSDSDYDYVEWAQTKAIGRALAYAGFGQQFCDILDRPEPEQVDSPVVIPQTQQSSAQNTPSNQSAAQSNQQQSTVTPTPPSQQAQQQQPPDYGTEIDFPDEDLPFEHSEEVIFEPPINHVQPPTQLNPPVQNPQESSTPTVDSTSNSSNPSNKVEQTKPLDDYLNLDITFGYNRGQTLGDLYKNNDKKSLEWLAYTYKGNNKELKAGAQLLLSELQQQQQKAS